MAEHSPEHRAKIAAGLKRAYAERRREPNRTGNGGYRHTPESRTAMSVALKGRSVWNKGLKTGPQDPEVVARRAAAQTGTTRAVTDAVLAGRVKNAVAHTGKKQSAATRAKRGASLRLAYAEGRKTVKPESGFGKGSWYNSPFQGCIWLRSSSEVQRAKELDAEGAVWFYEALRYSVVLDNEVRSYTPDFWVVQDVHRTNVPEDLNPKLFLSIHPHVVEDVKGWWKPTHKTYRKVMAFIEQHPEVSFRVVIREGMPNAA